MGLGLGLGIQFNSLGGMVSKILTWGKSIPARFWGTTTPEYWGGLDAQAEVHYNRVIADGGVVPAGLGGVNSFFQVVKGVYGTSDINTAISAAYDPHYLGYRLGAGSGTTLGQAARTLYAPKGIFGGIGTGSAYWEGVGVAGNYVSTPNAAANQITGDIEVIANLIPDSVTTLMTYASKFGNSSGANSWLLQFRTDGTLRINLTIGGTTFNYNSTTTHGIAAGSNVWIKVNRVQSSGAINFYKSSDGTTYTQIGTTVSGSTSAIDNATYNVNIGAFENGVTQPFLGKILRVTIANSIGGTPVVDFNANQYTGANTWTSTTGEVWTVNSTGAGLADVTQTTAASQPLLLAHTGENYWFGSGVTGNFVSTPNAAANQITGNIDLIAYIDYKNNGTFQTIQSKIIQSTGFCYGLFINSSNQIYVSFGNGASETPVNSTASLGATYTGWIKASRTASSGVVTWWTSSDSPSISINSINWASFGTPATSYIGTLGNPNNTVQIGAFGTTQAFLFQGKIYRAAISNSIGGTPVVDFNPSSYNPSTSQTQWTSATGEVWSINVGTATTGYKGAVITKSIIMRDGVDDVMDLSSFVLAQPFTLYNSFNNIGDDANGFCFDSINTSANRILMLRDGSNNFSYESSPVSSGAIGIVKTVRTLELNTAIYNSSSSLVQRNNGTATNGNLGTAGFTSLRLGRATGSGGTNGNYLHSTFLVVRQADNSTQRTAMYNYIKSINNNAF